MGGATHIDAKNFQGSLMELARQYAGFPWESQIWSESGHRRSPYRTLLLFGLSPRTRDWLLVNQCQRLFALCSDTKGFIATIQSEPGMVSEIVRKGQWPFMESVVQFLRDHDGIVPRDRDQLQTIKGIGEKIAECVVGYGFGEEALPVDGHVRRVAGRMFGLEGNITASDLRSELRRVWQDNRCQFQELGLEMIDLHEIYRLHGQVVCNKSPQCSVCPVTYCRYRQTPSSVASKTSVSASYWQEWRELLLEPTAEPIYAL